LPEHWCRGQKVRFYVFSFIPIGVQELYFETIDHDDFRIVTRESDRLVRSSRFQHRSVQIDLSIVTRSKSMLAV
jgi:hypothetical protein